MNRFISGENGLLQLYQKQLGQYKVLDNDQEKQLFELYFGGDLAAKDKIICSNLRLVYKIARAYCNDDEQLLLDLIQEGSYGLIVAVDRYDLSKNVRFSVFAANWIKKYIYQFLNENQMIRIPESIYHKLKIIRSVQQEYAQKNNEYPSDEQLRQLTGYSKEDIGEVLSYNFVFSSIDEQIDDNTTLLDFLSEENDQNLANRIIEDLIDSLEDEADQRIIRMYLGIGCKPKNYQQIGEAFGISKQAVGQKYKRAIQRIKEKYDQ